VEVLEIVGIPSTESSGPLPLPKSLCPRRGLAGAQRAAEPALVSFHNLSYVGPAGHHNRPAESAHPIVAPPLRP
jgi:hypothetical protein